MEVGAFSVAAGNALRRVQARPGFDILTPMKSSLAQLARQRLAVLPPAPPSAAVQQAKVDFFEALVARNNVAAKAAMSIIQRHARPGPELSPAERAKRSQRVRVLAALVVELRKRREEDARGVVRPDPTPEEIDEGRALADRFTRWMSGDESAGPFE